MIRLTEPNNILYDSSVVRSVDRFHRLHRNVQAYITKSWALVFVSIDDTTKTITVEPDCWLPEYGDFYKVHQENDTNGSSEDEQNAQGGDPQ